VVQNKEENVNIKKQKCPLVIYSLKSSYKPLSIAEKDMKYL
jgi:hypothetical protein